MFHMNKYISTEADLLQFSRRRWILGNKIRMQSGGNRCIGGDKNAEDEIEIEFSSKEEDWMGNLSLEISLKTKKISCPGHQ